MARARLFVSFFCAGLGSIAAGPAWPQASPFERLAEDVSAVIIAAGGPSLLLIETDHGVSATRLLGVGEAYADGWRLAAVEGEIASLQKDGETRRVVLRRIATAPSGESDLAPNLAVMSLSNAAAQNGEVFDEAGALQRGDFRSVAEATRRTQAQMDVLRAEQRRGGDRGEFITRFFAMDDVTTAIRPGRFGGSEALFKVTGGVQTMVITNDLRVARVLADPPPRPSAPVIVMPVVPPPTSGEFRE